MTYHLMNIEFFFLIFAIWKSLFWEYLIYDSLETTIFEFISRETTLKFNSSCVFTSVSFNNIYLAFELEKIQKKVWNILYYFLTKFYVAVIHGFIDIWYFNT